MLSLLSYNRALVYLLLISPFASTVLAQANNLNPEGAGCVDPKGFLDCYDAGSKQLTECSKVANSTCSDTNTHLQTCLSGCSGHHLASKVGCWLQSCWNKVYSCEYQRTAAEYIVGVGLVQTTVKIPFYPPPDGDLPGGCSCNIGNVVGNLSQIPTYHCMPAAQTGNQDVFAECTCCQSAFPLSNALNACPKSDLSLFDVATQLQKVQKTMLEKTPNNCAVLDSGAESSKYCADTYGVVEYAGPNLYNPVNLPNGVPGTEPISNLPGTPFTTIASVITLALDPGYSSVITPASFNAKNADKTSAVADPKATAAVTGTASGTATGTKSAPASTSSKSVAKQLEVSFAGSLLISGAIAILM